MTLTTILLIILILILIGVIPTWPHSRDWGYVPGGIVGIILIVVLILLLMGASSADRASYEEARERRPMMHMALWFDPRRVRFPLQRSRLSDAARADAALRGIEGKRLTYRRTG